MFIYSNLTHIYLKRKEKKRRSKIKKRERNPPQKVQRNLLWRFCLSSRKRQALILLRASHGNQYIVHENPLSVDGCTNVQYVYTWNTINGIAPSIWLPFEILLSVRSMCIRGTGSGAAFSFVISMVWAHAFPLWTRESERTRERQLCICSI